MLISHGGFVLLVSCKLLLNCPYFLEQWDQDNEGRCCECPSSADHSPGVELVVVKDVNGEHGARPDNNKQDCEADSSNVGGDLGSPELSDDNVQWWPVMEVLNIIQIEFSLVLGHPGAQGVVNVSGLLPLLLLNLRSHVPPCDVGHQNGEESSHSNGCDVSKQHWHLLSCVLHKGGSRQSSFKGAGISQPDGQS